MNMAPYHKIQTVYNRSTDGKILEGVYSRPEFQLLKDIEWWATEKIDGTNIRVNVQPNGGITFAGRTDKSQLQASLFHRLGEIFYPIRDQLVENFTNGVTFYGEGCGPKIQKGGENYGTQQGFILFDVRIGHIWLTREDVGIIADRIGVSEAPVVAKGNLQFLVDLTKEGMESAFGNFQSEGIVARPVIELSDRLGQRVITKLKTKDFQK